MGGLDLKASWIIQVYPKSNGKFSEQRVEIQIGVTELRKPRNTWNHQKLEQVGEGFFPRNPLR